MEINLLSGYLGDREPREFVLEITKDMLFNSNLVHSVSKLGSDRHFKTIPISIKEHLNLISKDITIVKMTSDIIINRYIKLNMDEGEE